MKKLHQSRLACHSSRTTAKGFGVMAALFVLVMLAGMAAAVVRLGWSQQTTFSQDILSAQANQAARAGVQWGIYQALKGTWTACGTATQTLDLQTPLGMWVTVTCSQTSYNEGESGVGTPTVVKVYNIEAVACNGLATCPDNTAAVQPYYVERKQQAVLSN
jgi:MSHA biogenesis protein MshP